MFLLPSHEGSVALYIQPRSHMIFVLCVKCISCRLGFYCIFKGSTGLPYKLFEASSVVNFPLWLLFGKLIQQPDDCGCSKIRLIQEVSIPLGSGWNSLVPEYLCSLLLYAALCSFLPLYYEP